MLNENEIAGFHIELTNMCALKCAGCARTRFIEQWPTHWKNASIDLDALNSFIDIDLSGIIIELCGNYGDPIYHRDFHKALHMFKDRDAVVEINTNGSYKTEQWWRTTCELLDKEDKIIFGIDGTPDIFTQYRENADWDSIKTAIETTTQYSVRTEWQLLPFAFNEDRIEEAEELAYAMNVDKFYVYPSDRFDDKTQHLIPVQQLHIRDRYDSQNSFKQSRPADVIKPQCNNKKMHFISAQGFYAPCCYIQDHRFYYKTIFGKNKEQFSIAKTTFSQLIKQKPVTDFNQSLAEQSVCQFNCPKI